MGKNGATVEYNVSKDTDNSSAGKKYYAIESSATRCGFSEKVFDILKLTEEKNRIISTQFPQFGDQAKLMTLKANMALLHNLCKTNDKKYLPIENKCLAFVHENKKYFKPGIATDSKWFWILTHHLYKPYKFIYRIKRNLK